MNEGDEEPVSSLIREVRIVDVTGREPVSGVVDVRIDRGDVVEIGARLRRHGGDVVHDGGGRWAIPGLWDAHVHSGQWASNTSRLDVAAVGSVGEAREVLLPHLATPGTTAVVGFGFRCATWEEQPTVAHLDAISLDRPVVLVSGDCHSGWLNSRALSLLGLAPRPGLVAEQVWFDTFPRLAELPGVSDAATAGYRRAARRAAAAGVVGVVDFEFTRGFEEWPERSTRHGIDLQRVRIGTYADGLDDVIAAGLRTGDPLDEQGLLRMGPLKIISDGSLNTRTAHCCEPYADAAELAHPHGVQNVAPDELRRLLTTARGHGLHVALHAIGDAAVRDALDAFDTTSAAGTIEHAQLVRWDDIPRMARLGVGASVQPAHLLDDRDVTAQCWPDRAERCFPLRSLTDHGVHLSLGSDAPVSPLDPWLAMAAAVHRSGDDRDPWRPEQALTVAEALAASTDEMSRVTVGSPGDLVLLDDDPLTIPSDSREAAARLRETRAAATIVGGRLTHG